MKAFIATLFVLVLLIACSQTSQQTPVRAPSAPAAEQTPPSAQVAESGNDNTNIVVSGTDKTLGEVNKTTALDINSVACDKANRKITFRFKNDDVKSWQMNQEIPFPAPKDLDAVRIYINSYEVNGRNPYIVNGETMFGPQTRFSDNCGGVEILKPGDDVTCTLYPVPLKSANGFTAGNNEILVHSPTSKHIIQFTCEE